MWPFESMSLWNWTATTSTAYWDYKQWSIWYGTWSYKGEVITEEEARRRFYETTAVWFDRVYSQLPWLTEDQYVALTSFAYNCPAWFRDVVKRGLDKHQYWCKTAGGKVLRGLVNRRNAEAKLLWK
jgi:GH24 family phage-related lysozyme (muramidase)